jgi:hypothetical protein
VVGDRYSLHAEIFGGRNQVGDANRPIEHGILGVDVEMNKGCGHGFFNNCAILL